MGNFCHFFWVWCVNNPKLFSRKAAIPAVILTSREEAPLRLCANAQWGQDLHGPHTGSRPSRPPWPPGSPAFVPTQVALQGETGAQTSQAHTSRRTWQGCTKTYCSKIRSSPYTTSSAGSLSLSPTIFVPTQTYMPASLFLVWEIISFPPRIWKKQHSDSSRD